MRKDQKIPIDKYRFPYVLKRFFGIGDVMKWHEIDEQQAKKMLRNTRPDVVKNGEPMYWIFSTCYNRIKNQDLEKLEKGWRYHGEYNLVSDPN